MSEQPNRPRPSRSRNAAGERLPDQALPLPAPAPFGSWAERRIARARLNTTGDERLDEEIREALVQVAAEADRLWDGIARRAKGSADDPDLRAEIIAMIRSLEGVWARERHEAVDFTWARRSAARAAAWGAAAAALEQLDPLLVDQLSHGITVEPISLRIPEVPAGTLAPQQVQAPAAKTPIRGTLKQAPAKPAGKAPAKKAAVKPLKKAPVKPIKKAPAKKAPVKKAPVKPLKKAPAKKAPVKKAPVKPLKKAPAKKAPIKKSPVKPLKKAPVKPIKKAPAKKAPVKKAPVKPLKKAPAKKVPVKKVPKSAKKVPVKATEKASAKRPTHASNTAAKELTGRLFGRRVSVR